MAQNARSVVFLVGFTLLYVGLAGWSYRAANLTAGGVLMALALVPYLRRVE